MSPTSVNRCPRLRPTDVGDSDLEAVEAHFTRPNHIDENSKRSNHITNNFTKRLHDTTVMDTVGVKQDKKHAILFVFLKKKSASNTNKEKKL
ncbi:MAG: hypothetical protein K2H04_09860 [Bacteroidaceae bacterium]|nr:hypothetical protein [Bacteroidaceae bacterium]